MYRAKFDEQNKLWSSCDAPSVFNPNISISYILLRSLKLNGSKIAQVSDDTGQRFTFEDLHNATIRAAQNLHKRGYERNQVFGIMSRNVAHLAPIVFASFCLGCPLNTLNTTIEKVDLIRELQVTEPSVIFCEVEMYDLVNECLIEIGKRVQIFTFEGIKGDSEPVENLFTETGVEEDFSPVDVDGINGIAAIISSSGTSGKSKQICLSHAALISHLGSFNIINANDIFFSTSSLHWITGFLSLLMGTINGATRIITTESFSPEMQLRIIEKYNVTVAYCSPFHLVSVLESGTISKANLMSLRHMFVSGWKIPFSVLNEFNSFLPNGNVHNGYGLTEMAAWVTVDFPKFSENDTVGRLLNGFTVKIIDRDGIRCGIDTDGEICIKDQYEFLGYYKNDELIRETVDFEGFFLTGDIGHFDRNGNLYITDRKKDVIAYEDWVWPFEIENILLQSDDIKAVCAVGVPYNEVIEVPAAVVERNIGSIITEENICQMVRDNLDDNYKLRGGVYFVDSIPRGASGKPLRRKAKEIATRLYEASHDL